MKNRLYRIWHNMKSRCYKPNAPNFKYYGGKGIRVCEEWKDNFQAFYDWAVAHGYRGDLTIDRIDNNGNYCPENCQWKDMMHQNNHTSKNHYIAHNGETKTSAEWARQYGIERNLFNKRIRRGWSFEKAATTAKGRHIRNEAKNQSSV